MRGDEHDAEHGGGEAGLTVAEHADEQDRPGDEPQAAERREADRAHRAVAVAALERLRGVALGEEEDDVLGEPRDGRGRVAEQRQSGDDEDRQRHGEQHEVAVADQGRPRAATAVRRLSRGP